MAMIPIREVNPSLSIERIRHKGRTAAPAQAMITASSVNVAGPAWIVPLAPTIPGVPEMLAMATKGPTLREEEGGERREKGREKGREIREIWGEIGEKGKVLALCVRPRLTTAFYNSVYSTHSNTQYTPYTHAPLYSAQSGKLRL